MRVASILAAVYEPLTDEEKILFLTRLAHAVTVSLRGYYLLPAALEGHALVKSAALNELLHEVTAQLESQLDHFLHRSSTLPRSSIDFIESISLPMIDCQAIGSLLVVFHAAARTVPVEPGALAALQEAIDSAYKLTPDPRLEALAL